MALKATIYKVDLNIANMDKHYFANHNFTLACHPSETTERLMLKILAFCYLAHDDLEFTKGLYDVDLPELWRKNLTDDILQWVEIGMPDETRLRKSCQRAEQVVVFTYQPLADVQNWWRGVQAKAERFNNLAVLSIDEADLTRLASFNARTMQIQCNIQDDHLFISDDVQSMDLVFGKVKVLEGL
jgi:uncharacterized protein YaeQ